MFEPLISCELHGHVWRVQRDPAKRGVGPAQGKLSCGFKDMYICVKKSKVIHIKPTSSEAINTLPSGSEIVVDEYTVSWGGCQCCS